MGGAAVARAALALEGALGTRERARDDRYDLEGIVVIDVVEGTAMEALPSMEASLRGRPLGFPSPGAAVAWSMRAGLTTNLESARVSVPSQLREHSVRAARDANGTPGLGTRSSRGWLWRVDVRETAKHWPSWFEHLSSVFLDARSVKKLLILAGTDRLDVPLMRAQMQGKFQLTVFPDTGHAVHEDEPEKVAEALAGFLKRCFR
jgi:protein phosphatase methylesterase 1